MIVNDQLFFTILIIGCAVLVQCSWTSLRNEGYTIAPEFGKAYKIMYQARPWEHARLLCVDDGGQLAVPKTEEEFLFVQNLVKTIKFHDVKGSSNVILNWIGINNLQNYTEWVDLEGENIENSTFHKWAGGTNGVKFSDDPNEPHCAGIDPRNYGFRHYWCHLALAYICEKKHETHPTPPEQGKHHFYV